MSTGFLTSGYVPDPVALSTALSIAQPVSDLGGAFMLHPETLGPGKSAGYPGGFSYYVVGRGGVLGDVDAGVVSSAFGFFAPALVRSLWEQGIALEGARAGANRYAEACAQWGRQRLTLFTGAERLAQLLSRIVDNADQSGLALFAGWQSQVRSDDSLGRCYQLVHILRELRGSVHIVAVAAHNLSPIQAIMAHLGAQGADHAKKFGWSAPFPDGAPLRSTFESAEELTNSMMARHLSILSHDEQGELVALIARVSQLVRS